MRLRFVLKAVLYLAAIYFIFATLTYRFKHPDMTETELFLNIPKALMFNY